MSKQQDTPKIHLEKIDDQIVVVKVFPYKQPKQKKTRKFRG